MKTENMLKKLTSLLLALAVLGSVLCVPVSAQSGDAGLTAEAEQAISDEYLSYLELDEETQSSLLPPLTIPTQAVDITTDSPSAFPLKGSGASSVPTAYDPRNKIGTTVNYLSDVQDQLSTGSCWTFSATANVENYLNMTKGIDTDTNASYDFSTRHMEFSASEIVGDLQNFYTYTRRADSGGNQTYAASYFMRGNGPVANVEPMKFVNYSYNNVKYPARADMDMETEATVLDYYFYPSVDLTSKENIAASIEALKAQMKADIMAYGSIDASILSSGFDDTATVCYNAWDGSGYWKYEPTTDGSYTTYFTNTDGGKVAYIPVDHAVLIVGWDDEYTWDDKEWYYNFQEKGEVKDINGSAFTKGAWIVQNSWGTGVGDGGFFYVPYCELSMYSQSATAAKAASKEDYSYDNRYVGAVSTFEKGWGTRVSGSDGETTIEAYTANIFPRETGDEKITAVSVAAYDGMTCTVYVVDGNIEELSSYNLTAYAQEVIEAEGFETLEFVTPATITQESFTVIVKYSSDSEFRLPLSLVNSHEMNESTKSLLSDDGFLWEKITTTNEDFGTLQGYQALRGAFNVHTENVSGRTSVTFDNQDAKAVTSVFDADGNQIPPLPDGSYNLSQNTVYNYTTSVYDANSDSGASSFTGSFTTGTGESQSVATYHTVSFNANGGTFTGDASQKVNYGNSATKPADPAREGYVFKHWSLTADGEEFDFTTVITADTTLYAVWDKLHTVTFDANGGTLTDSATQKIVNGQTAAKPTDPTKDSSTFTYWSLTADGAEFDFATAITADTTLYAVWDKTHTVTFDANGGTLTGDASQKVNHRTAATKPTDPTKDNSTFKHWSLTTDGAEFDFATAITADITLYAVWETAGGTGGGAGGSGSGGTGGTGGGDSGGGTGGDAGGAEGEGTEEEQPSSSLVTAEDIALVEETFTDLTSDWSLEAIAYVYREGLFMGTSETNFSPKNPMNRGMVATVLYRMEGEPAAMARSVFSDVPSDAYYAAAVSWAAQNGIIAGISAELYAPSLNVTREQLVTLLYRYALYRGCDLSGESIEGFEDYKSVSDYAVDAMKWAVKNGIITGRTNGTIDPRGNASREEVALMIMRFETFLLTQNR